MECRNKRVCPAGNPAGCFLLKLPARHCRGEACPARYLAIPEQHASTQKHAGAEKRLPCVGGAVMAQAMTEGVYTIDMVQAIVRYSPTKSNRTPPPSRLTPTHLPLHRGALTQKYGAASSESKPSPAYRGWHGASRDGCGGDPVRISEPLGIR